MHIITKRVLKQSAQTYGDAETSLRLWQKTTENATWKSILDVRQNCPSADSVGNFTVFNIGGNKYRLITYIDYTYSKVFMRGPLLTHAQYDKDEWKNDAWYQK